MQGMYTACGIKCMPYVIFSQFQVYGPTIFNGSIDNSYDGRCWYKITVISPIS